MIKIPYTANWDLVDALEGLQEHLKEVLDLEEHCSNFDDENYSYIKGEDSKLDVPVGYELDISPLENLLISRPDEVYSDEITELYSKYNGKVAELVEAFTKELKDTFYKYFEQIQSED